MGAINLIGFDVETSTKHNNSICQIAIAEIHNGVPKVVFETLVKPPGNEFALELSGIHGIYPEDTESSPTFDQVWPEIQPYFDGIVVAHNAPFDVTKLSGTLEYYGLDLPNLNSVCTYELTGLRLPLACSAYGIELLHHHNAASDALACLSIYYKHILGHKPVLDSLKNKVESGPFFAYKQVESTLLKPISDAPDNYLKGKKVVFTGDLQSLSRNEAAKAAQSLGADVNTSISKNTRIVVLGRGAGPKKLEKINELQGQGNQIETIDESRFLEIISQTKQDL
jgi:DNA polymerase-3 subunit epsilon